MDYKRIYEDLIASRSVRPKLENEYYERHHILPRCMGGGDEEENLIYLTAEEHFIAHMLLAKAHGGKLWFAAQAMCMSRRKNGRKIKHRRIFATVRKEVLKERTKDSKVYRFVKMDTGEVHECTVRELRERFNLGQQVYSLTCGGFNVIKGFCLEGYKPKPPLPPAVVYQFQNVATGEVYTSPCWCLYNLYPIAASSAYALAKGKIKRCKDLILYTGESVAA